MTLCRRVLSGWTVPVIPAHPVCTRALPRCARNKGAGMTGVPHHRLDCQSFCIQGGTSHGAIDSPTASALYLSRTGSPNVDRYTRTKQEEMVMKSNGTGGDGRIAHRGQWHSWHSSRPRAGRMTEPEVAPQSPDSHHTGPVLDRHCGIICIPGSSWLMSITIIVDRLVQCHDKHSLVAIIRLIDKYPSLC